MAAKKPTTMQKANIYDAQRRAHSIEFDMGDTTIPSDYCSNGELDIFQIKHRIPDVWRYTVKVFNGKIERLEICKPDRINSNFQDSAASDAIGTKVILLVLESPHIDEYEKYPTNTDDLKPKAPAQGSTGRNIEKYLTMVLGKISLPDACYSLVISNPIPYICSLGIVTHKLDKILRDNLWKAIWNIKNDEGLFVMQEEFMARYKKYNPAYTLNCCTKELAYFVTELLVKNGVREIYQTYHPSIQWNTCKGNVPVNAITV
jgi:hypothetical protein